MHYIDVKSLSQTEHEDQDVRQLLTCLYGRNVIMITLREFGAALEFAFRLFAGVTIKFWSLKDLFTNEATIVHGITPNEQFSRFSPILDTACLWWKIV